MRVEHDGTILNFSVFFEHAGEVDLSETRVNACNEQIRTAVDSPIVITIFHASVARRWRSAFISQCCLNLWIGRTVGPVHLESGCEQVRRGHLGEKQIDHDGHNDRLMNENVSIDVYVRFLGMHYLRSGRWYHRSQP